MRNRWGSGTLGKSQKVSFQATILDYPSENAGMSNEKGYNPRLKLMAFD